MSFAEALSSVFTNYFNFSGRARRTEYWLFTLFNFFIGIILGALQTFVSSDLEIISIIYSVAIFFPSLAVTVRRLHDTGRSGWFIFLPILPYVIGVVLFVISGIEAILYIFIALFAVMTIIYLVWLFTDSQPGTNQYGPNPKEKGTKDDEEIIQKD